MTKVVLDPSGLYPIPSGYTPITTEVEWLQYFFRADCTYWVSGKRLCDWTREWLRVWNQTEAIIEEKPSQLPLISPLEEQQDVPLYPVRVVCRGAGKARQPGELEVIIDNDNSVPLTELCLYVKEFPTISKGQTLNVQVAAQEKVILKIGIPEWPELPIRHNGNNLRLSGSLKFSVNNGEVASTPLNSESVIVVNQMFRSELNIDEFF